MTLSGGSSRGIGATREPAISAANSAAASSPMRKPGSSMLERWRTGIKVLCVGGRSALDDAASLLVAQLLLRRTGIESQLVESDSLSVMAVARLEATGVGLICISYLDVSSPAHLRFVVRRLRRKFPEAKVLVGCWGQDSATAEEMANAAKGDLSATSFQVAVDLCVRTLSGADDEGGPVDDPLTKVTGREIPDTSGLASGGADAPTRREMVATIGPS